MGEAALTLSDEVYKPLAETASTDFEADARVLEGEAPGEMKYTFTVVVGGRTIRLVSNLEKLPPEVENALFRLADLYAQPGNWDSYGAKAINKELVEEAVETILESRRMCCVPEIFAMPNSGLEFIWTHGNRELVAELTEPGSFGAYYVDTENGHEWEPEEPVTWEEVKAYLGKLKLVLD